ncbi:MAG TPA: hypothetical protein DCZ94_11530 [Lentisphaeria bacterium]|nr:MAG: hypothetical protein A2X48_17620 [Lentisphaerae bacterium GWF2_49_21]HBC87578.1 hypothetical protein [Lentisphaeria bacterium]
MAIPELNDLLMSEANLPQVAGRVWSLSCHGQDAAALCRFGFRIQIELEINAKRHRGAAVQSQAKAPDV